MTFKTTDTPTIRVGFVTRAIEFWDGRKGSTYSAVRLIKEASGWRVDRADAIAGTWLPWEPVTSESFRYLKDAKSVASAWARGEVVR